MKNAFIAYITLGDGGLDYSLQAALALVKGGVDILEIGIPFSDPVADGPVIQKAMERSLAAGTRVRDVLPFLKAFREHSDIPVIVFSYCNPILAAGPAFLQELKEAGAQGLLQVDLSYENVASDPLDPIFVVSTATTEKRVKKIAEKAKGFIYYACQKGTTGKRGGLPEDFSDRIALIKRHTSLPVVAGFGISTKEMAKQVLQHADGFVVGSYFVEAMAKKPNPEELTILAKNIDPREVL